MPANPVRPSKSLGPERPGEAALHRVVLQASAQPAGIHQAEAHVATDHQVDPGIDEGSVAGQRHPIDGEICSGAGEPECADRRQVTERVLPLHRGMRHQGHAVGQTQFGCRPDAERRIADIHRGGAAGCYGYGSVGHLGMAMDIAKGIVFLASDDAGYMNGAGLIVDGGVTAT